MSSITTLRWRRRFGSVTIESMLTSFLALALLAFSGAPPTATPVALAPLPHVRPLDRLATNLIATGARDSSTFAGLTTALDRAPGFVVYVATVLQAEHRGSIVFVTRAGGITYLLIRVAAEQNDGDRVAVLAHEMTHAVEIAGANPPVASARDLQRLYRCIGIDSSGVRLESEAAVRAERAVHREIARAPTPAEAATSHPSLAIQPGHVSHE